MNFLLIILRCLMGFPPQPPSRLLPILVRRDGRLASGPWAGRCWPGSEFREELPPWSWFRLATLFDQLGALARRLGFEPGRKSSSRAGRQAPDENVARKRTA